MKLQESGPTTSPYAVVLLHGTPTHPRVFDRLATRLASAHRTVVVTLPGYCGEAPTSGSDAVRQVRDELVTGLRSRGIEEVSIVGFSGGGFRAFDLACSGALPVRKIVALGAHAGLEEQANQAMRGTIAALRASADLHGVFPSLMLSKAWLAAHPESAQEVNSWLDAIPGPVLGDELESMLDAGDLRPGVAALELPILLRAGSEDAAVPADYARAIAASNPRATLQLVTDAGHALLIEDEEATLREVVGFLEA